MRGMLLALGILATGVFYADAAESDFATPASVAPARTSDPVVSVEGSDDIDPIALIPSDDTDPEDLAEMVALPKSVVVPAPRTALSVPSASSASSASGVALKNIPTVTPVATVVTPSLKEVPPDAPAVSITKKATPVAVTVAENKIPVAKVGTVSNVAAKNTNTVTPLQPTLAPTLSPSDDPTFKIVLKGTMPHSLEVKQSDSPVLIKGNFVIPAGCTLKINAGVVVALQGDEKLPAPQAGSPDPRTGAVVWVWGALHIEGLTGNPVELVSRTSATNQDASLLFYGAESSLIEGTRIKNVSITQTAGTTSWLNCEVVNARHYALASGVGVFTQCSFKNCGGLFATYNAGSWSLMARHNLFENCREGIILGSDPGETRLVVEKNNFISAKGAHIRVLLTSATRATASRKTDADIFIGENWYGTAIAEEVDMRLVDRRNDAALRTRLNIRPPSERPYDNTGAGVSAAILTASQKEHESMLKRLTTAHPWPKAKAPVSGNVAVKSPTPSTASTSSTPSMTTTTSSRDKGVKDGKPNSPETAVVHRTVKKNTN